MDGIEQAIVGSSERPNRDEWTAPVVRNLVRQLAGDRVALDLLYRLLADLAPTLLPLIPPPPAPAPTAQDGQTPDISIGNLI